MTTHEHNRRRFLQSALMTPIGASLAFKFLENVAAAPSTASTASTAAPASAAGRLPNIILIVSDDQGWGDLPVQWKDTNVRMPVLGQMARKGVRFPSYHTEPLCGPSRACMMTGQYSMENGMWRGPGSQQIGEPSYRGVKHDVKMLPEFLKEAGYSTACVGKWHLGENEGDKPWERGFDDYWGFLGGAHPYWLDKACRLVHNGKPYNPGGHTTEHFTDKSIELIRAMAAKDKPFFHYLAYNAVHGPMWTEETKRASAPEKWLKEAEARGIEFPRRDYAAILEHMDDCIGRVLALLRELKIEEDSLVIFVSDNGACLMTGETEGRFPGNNGPLRGGKGTTWQGGLNVPLMMEWKGRFPEGWVSEGVVMHCDIFSTILAAAGLPTPAMNGKNPTRGMSLLPHILSSGAEAIPERSMFFELVGSVGLRKGAYKLWGKIESSRADWKEHVAELQKADLKLFDLSKDVGEKNDLRTALPDVYASLKRELIEYFQHINAEYPGAESYRPEDKPTTPTAPSRAARKPQREERQKAREAKGKQKADDTSRNDGE